MKLFNKTIDRQLFSQYSLGSDLSKQEVVVKIFNPQGAGTWFILNSDPEDPDYLWAIVDLGYGAEVGSVSRSDLENYRGRFGLGFERDLSFDPINALELYQGLLNGEYYADGGGVENKIQIKNFADLKQGDVIRRKDKLGTTIFVVNKSPVQSRSYKNEYNALATCIVSNTDYYKPYEEYYITSVIRYGKLGNVDYIGKRNYNDGFDYSIYLPKSNKKFADGGGVRSSQENTFDKIFLHYGFTKKRGAYGIRPYEHKKLGTYAQIDDKTRSIQIETPDDEYKGGYSVKAVIEFLKSKGFEEKGTYADGGDIESFSDNQRMIMNQNVEVEHHHEELEDILEDEVEVPAWVVAKMETATQNLSDITHYLDGQKEIMEDQLEGDDDDDDDDDDDEMTEIENKEVVEPINVSAGTKAELTKKFTDDAWGNLRGFLKGMEGIDLRDDYTFDYKDEQFEVEPIINSDENGVSNAVFTIFDGDGEEQGEIIYSREGGKQKFTANSDYFEWRNAKFEDGGYFDGTIPNVSTYMSTYAKGGEIAKAEILGLSKNIMGTTDIEMKISGMRKSQDFIVYPISKDDTDKIITIQSSTRIGKIDLSSGRGLMSQSHSNGAYFVHFQMDKLTPFTVSESDLEDIKAHIFKTAGDNVGSRGIVSDNSGASRVFAKGGEVYSHKHSKGWGEDITIELLEPTAKGWKVKQTTKKGRKTSTKTAFFSKEEISELFEKQYAKGGVTYFDDRNQHYLSRPSGSIEKEILEKVKGRIDSDSFVGSFGWRTPNDKYADGYLYKLDDFDKRLIKDLKLKQGEEVFRYVNRTTAIGGMMPFIKINIEKGLLYFPVSNENDDILFETKSIKPSWINLIQGSFAKGGIVVTSIKDIPNFEERLNQGKITYRGLGLGKLFDDFYELTGTTGTRIKVDGKEYYITDEEFKTFSRDADGKLRVRFDAPYRKGYANGGGIGFIPMDLEETLRITAKWGGTDIKGVIGILNAMIDSGLTDEDLQPKPTKSGSAYQNAVARKTKEIWAKIEPNYKGDLKGNMPYSTISRLVSRSRTSDDVLKRFKPYRKYQKDSFADGGFMNDVYADGGVAEEMHFFLVSNEKDNLYNYVGYSIDETITDKQGNEFEKLYFENKKLPKKYNINDLTYLQQRSDFTQKDRDGETSFVILVDYDSSEKPYYYLYNITRKFVASEGSLDWIKSNLPKGWKFYDSYADGGFMNDVYADGGQIRVGDRFKYDWTDGRTDGVRGYDVVEVIKSNATSSRDFKTKVMVLKVIESSDPSNVGRIDEDLKPSFKKAIRLGMIVPLQERRRKMVDEFYAKGGMSKFEKLSAKVAKQYEGKPVKSEYQDEYGKTYSKAEAQEVGDKVAGKVKAMQTDKKVFGGLFGGAKKLVTPSKKYPNISGKQVALKSGKYVQVFEQFDNKISVVELGKIGSGVRPHYIDISEVDMDSFKAGGKIAGKRVNGGTETLKRANELAKKIRKDGESWLDAKKRAFAQLKK